MRKFLDISSDLSIQPCLVAAVKRINEETCTVFMAGQSAADGGFTVERDYDEVVGEIGEALTEEDNGEEES